MHIRRGIEFQAEVNSNCRSTEVSMPGVVKEHREGQCGLSGEN